MNMHFRPAAPEDIDIIITVLHEAWYPAYGNILSPAQSRYMLDTCFSKIAIAEQLRSGVRRFLLAVVAGRVIGYASFQLNFKKQGLCKLHQLYLLPGWQGKGYGKCLLTAVFRQARAAGQQQLILNVNRANTARKFYARMGFAKEKAVDIPIGNGYFMNDFELSRSLETVV